MGPDCHPELSLGCHLLLLADCFQAVVGIVPQPVAVFQAVFLGKTVEGLKGMWQYISTKFRIVTINGT